VEKKIQFFSPNPVKNIPINTTPFIHKYLFKTKRFNSKANTRSFKGGVSLLSLGYVLFLVICL